CARGLVVSATRAVITPNFDFW
nr:immunoglobulin heavy chain junction region [Macaca mulatta]MOV47883.1 immunoglobulin heavy chain junction region [Macaca mulatta]MOV48218.1 immunoglobulin heavy chain junction region [Macaca mulatta]MOV48497.1 immunoglobulin heavy chain junction region [Macaca mulatta]MOV48640.1 immunoglobulin heavy chain junction region [Macaca mulatta]